MRLGCPLPIAGGSRSDVKLSSVPSVMSSMPAISMPHACTDRAPSARACEAAAMISSGVVLVVATNTNVPARHGGTPPACVYRASADQDRGADHALRRIAHGPEERLAVGAGRGQDSLGVRADQREPSRLLVCTLSRRTPSRSGPIRRLVLASLIINKEPCSLESCWRSKQQRYDARYLCSYGRRPQPSSGGRALRSDRSHGRRDVQARRAGWPH